MPGRRHYFEDAEAGLSFLKWGDRFAHVRGVVTPCREEYVIPARVVDDEGVERAVVGIDHEVFMDQTSLRRVVFPSTITFIMDFAFQGCTSLQEVVIPQFLIRIGHFAFSGCTSLKRFECLEFDERQEVAGSDFTLGIDEPWRFYTLLGEAAFAQCNNLEYVKGNFTFRPEDKPQSAFEGCESLKKIDGSFIVDNIDASDSEHYYGIPPRCFKGCKSLREVTIDGLCTVQNEEYVRSEAHYESFAGCESLERINGSMYIQTVYRHAFKDCNKLQNNPCARDFYVGYMTDLEKK